MWNISPMRYELIFLIQTEYIPFLKFLITDKLCSHIVQNWDIKK